MLMSSDERELQILFHLLDHDKNGLIERDSFVQLIEEQHLLRVGDSINLGQHSLIQVLHFHVNINIFQMEKIDIKCEIRIWY